MLTLLEFMSSDNSTVIMSSLGEGSRQKLELYGLSLGVNASERIRGRVISPTDEAATRYLRALWDEEKYLSQTKEPFEMLRKYKATFNETMFGYVRRMEVLHEDLRSDETLSEFLDAQVLEGAGLRDLSFDATAAPADTLARLKQISVWFRALFPYYYDGCTACQNREENAFIGFLRPSAEERTARAGRTEMYSCSKCRAVSRFPRFNFLNRVLQTRKGRCGEYSMLMYRMLRLLQYAVRWVVDWADHVSYVFSPSSFSTDAGDAVGVGGSARRRRVDTSRPL